MLRSWYIKTHVPRYDYLTLADGNNPTGGQRQTKNVRTTEKGTNMIREKEKMEAGATKDKTNKNNVGNNGHNRNKHL